MDPIFLILHGSFATPDSNWFMMLKERLERIGQTVLLPTFPVDQWDNVSADPTKTKENLTSWLVVAREALKDHLDKQFVIIGHSLGPLFGLHLTLELQLKVDCFIAVSPFLELDDDKAPPQIQAVNRSFYKTDFDSHELREAMKTAYVLYSDNDPYVPIDKSMAFADLIHASLIPVRGAAHMNAEVNMHEFPLVLELCKSRVDLNLYQKYIDHRAELFDEDSVNYHTEKLVEFSSKDIVDEGIFKFRNLQTSGFCTLPTNARIWDSQSLYMQESRKAARRLSNFVRVFIIEDPNDMSRPGLQAQIIEDLDGGVNVFGVRAVDLPEEVAVRDFGIWDDEYVCFVEDSSGPEAKVTLSSRSVDMQRAQKWKQIIVEQAKQVRNFEEMKKIALDS